MHKRRARVLERTCRRRRGLLQHRRECFARSRSSRVRKAVDGFRTYTSAQPRSSANLVQESPQNCDLTCPLCAIDPTVGQDKKAKKYTLLKHDSHIKSDFHSRESELRRAFNIDVDDRAAVNFPLCARRLNFQRFLKHVREKHSEQLVQSKESGAAVFQISTLEDIFSYQSAEILTKACFRLRCMLQLELCLRLVIHELGCHQIRKTNLAIALHPSSPRC